MYHKVSKFWTFVSILLFGIFADNCLAQNRSNNKLTRTTGSLFRTTPSAQTSLQEPNVLQQAIQDKIQNEYNSNDQYDQDFKWAAQMQERGLLDSEQIRSIAKNRAANRARESFEILIDGSDLERSYRTLEKGLKKFKDYSTVEFGKKSNGELFAHKLQNNKEVKEKPFAVFFLQPDLNNGISAVVNTKNNLRMEYQPSKGQLIFGYRINF